MICLKDFLNVLTEHGADICIEDTETGEHYIQYYNLEDIKHTDQPAYYEWLLGLEVKSYDSSSLLVVLSPYNCNETEYLTKCEYGSYDTDALLERAINDSELSFLERLVEVNNNRIK